MRSIFRRAASTASARRRIPAPTTSAPGSSTAASFRPLAYRRRRGADRRCPSACSLLTSRPVGKTEAGAGPGGSAVAGHIMRPSQIEMLDRTADADPHADLGTAGIEFFARQGLQRLAVLALERVDDPAIELLVDDKMAQASRADDADAHVGGITLHRFSDRL